MLKNSLDSYEYHPYIDGYFEDIKNTPVSEEIQLLVPYAKAKLNSPSVWLDTEKIDDMVRAIETYFEITLMPWQLFICALIHAYEKVGDRTILLFNTFFIMVGRGNGKNGFISALAWYFTTLNHGIRGYNVDIIANSEDQAMTSFNDIYDIIDDDVTGMLKPQFSYTKTSIKNNLTKSEIKYNTSNARTKDGKRSGCLIFDEVHEYENFKLINVFRSGFGKRPNSRTFYITTDGYVREGVLDQLLNLARKLLKGESKSRARMLPMIYKINNRDEAYNEKNWIMANPSLPYFPDLQEVMVDQFDSMSEIPEEELEFITKRMNLPAQDALTVVATEEQILATNRPIPMEALKGRRCVGGVDYAMTNDFCSVNLVFKMDGIYYRIGHTFICHKALALKSRKIEAPIDLWRDQGLVTVLPEPTIRPRYIAEWFVRAAAKYSLIDIKADDYKFTYLITEFEKAGLPLSVVRSGSRTHTQLSPLINAMFTERLLICGDNPVWRWYVRNVYKEKLPNDSIRYEKVEPIRRKTDGFFSFLHALSGEKDLEDVEVMSVEDMKPVHF